MKMLFNNHNDPAYEALLDPLLKKVFFSFQPWFDLGLWDQRYESHAMMEDGKIVSNIGVFRAKLLVEGRPADALSIGAVATLPAYRGRGYSRLLMAQLLARYPGVPMYLSANPSVVDFYPRFGFRRVTEWLPQCPAVVENPIPPCKLGLHDPKTMAFIKGRVQFSDRLDALNTDPVVIFNLLMGGMGDSLYELREIHTLVAATQTGETLHLAGVFSIQPITFKDLLAHLPFQGVSRITFDFMPYWSDCPTHMVQGDELWFVRNVSMDLGQVKFPQLSAT